MTRKCPQQKLTDRLMWLIHITARQKLDLAGILLMAQLTHKALQVTSIVENHKLANNNSGSAKHGLSGSAKMLLSPPQL